MDRLKEVIPYSFKSVQLPKFDFDRVENMSTQKRHAHDNLICSQCLCVTSLNRVKGIGYRILHSVCWWFEEFQLYFASPRSQPWRQRVFQRRMLIIACDVISVFSHSFKRNILGLTHKGCVSDSFLLWSCHMGFDMTRQWQLKVKRLLSLKRLLL